MPNASISPRQVHLDFHTSPHLRDVGVDFDAREFARTLKRAHVTSVTLFAKCHHGHLYYNTRRPERHPGLKQGFDLLAAQIEALHRENIRAPIYLSVQVDEYAANTHPEWVARNPDGTPVKWGKGVFSPGWQILDLSSPYRSYFAEQLAEVLAKFRPVDGIFFDMCWDQPSASVWAIEGMRRRGLNPESEADRARYARIVAHDFMRTSYRQVKRVCPRATVYFNSRPQYNLATERAWQTHVEIEALPTGGWGYLYFPKNVRYVRNFGRPMVGMTARFHKNWGDFGGLKPPAALHYEIAQMLAHGAACSIGDQLHPRGQLDSAAYDLIGEVYAHAMACEPWTTQA
ncbi:MAG: alpha-L-fucosidase, partial [Verrucomicrobiae bacterium]|nr:alpha-L-fucosidase [Verrucomicrobiae bacterium]